MIRSLFTLLIVFSSLAGFSQTDDRAPFLKTKQLPEFTLTDIDFKDFNQNTLSRTRSTIIMLFNPECDHCQQQLELLIATPQVAKTAQVVLSSAESQEINREFYKKYHLEKYPFIRLGKEYGYFFGGYYRPSTIPFIAIYNPKRQLVFYNHGVASKAQLLNALDGKKVPLK